MPHPVAPFTLQNINYELKACLVQYSCAHPKCSNQLLTRSVVKRPPSTIMWSTSRMIAGTRVWEIPLSVNRQMRISKGDANFVDLTRSRHLRCGGRAFMVKGRSVGHPCFVFLVFLSLRTFGVNSHDRFGCDGTVWYANNVPRCGMDKMFWYYSTLSD